MDREEAETGGCDGGVGGGGGGGARGIALRSCQLAVGCVCVEEFGLPRVRGNLHIIVLTEEEQFPKEVQ